MSSTDYDVVVVGLGPTGLTLANLLGRRGISVLVLEREPESTPTTNVCGSSKPPVPQTNSPRI
jgi:flavin-dependent dehydrogenase